MTRVLHLIPSLDPQGGGVAKAVRSFASTPAMPMVHEIATCDAPDAVWPGDESLMIHALGPGRFGFSYSPRLVPWLVANLPRFDAVIVHGLWQWPSLAVHLALEKCKERARRTQRSTLNPQLSTKIPSLYLMPHGMLDPYFQRAPERRIKAIRNWIYWKWIEHRVIDAADGLLFTCEEEMLLAREPFVPYRPKSEHVVGLGIDVPPAFAPSMQQAFAEKCPGLDGRPYLLFLSRIHPKKGVDLLIRAYAKVSNEWQTASDEPDSSPSTRHPSPATGEALPVLVIAGPCNDPAYLQKLKAEALCVPATPRDSVRIHFVDMLTGDAKWGALYGCDAFILPSHQENFGIAVVEALACGKPVLISNKVNIWREIEADGAGLVDEDTVEGTANLVRRFVADRSCISESKTTSCFQNHFAIEMARSRFASAIRR